MSRISYDLKAAAEETGLSQSYLKRVIADGSLPAKRTGETRDGEPTGKYLIREADLRAFVDGLVDA